MAEEVDVLVLGAGAAGLMCAARAGARGRRVLVLDHAEKPGKKILISGGGRCNFTNRGATWENFLSENPHFARSALARYTAADFLELVEAHGIPWHEKTLGQLFCDRSAQDILNLLLRQCARAGARIRSGVRVGPVAATGSGENARFRVETSADVIAAESVVVATGGLSIPKMGATGFGYDVARQFGLRIVEPRAGLVPLVFSPEDHARWCDLTGLSVEVVGRVEGTAGISAGRKGTRAVEFREKLLVTHRGVSGPAVLQVSSYWRPGEAVEFDLAPERQVTAEMREGAGSGGREPRRDEAALAAALRSVLPGRMAERWLALERPEAAGRNLSNAALADLERRLHAWRVVPAGTEGFAKAEVTAGGVATGELDPRTMEARRAPGLFFIGEVVDVTGWLGGYNFQWAWSSGVCAGDAA